MLFLTNLKTTTITILIVLNVALLLPKLTLNLCLEGTNEQKYNENKCWTRQIRLGQTEREPILKDLDYDQDKNKPHKLL